MTRHMRFAFACILLAAACSNTPRDTRLECDESGKCDVPDSATVKKQCENSRVNAMNEKRPHFVPTGVRWSCRDVNGVTPNDDESDDRGQEYCEYFSMLYTDAIPEVLIDEHGPVFCDAQTPCTEGTCDDSISSCVTGTRVPLDGQAAVLGKNMDEGSTVTPLDPKLTEGQVEWLSQNPSIKVGECVFTSWHADITRTMKGTTKVGGFSLNSKTPGSDIPLFQMGVQFNSNGAAKALVGDCLTPGKKSIKDGFTRGCSSCGEKECVPWRKSDPSVCTMAMRIAECGCQIDIAEPGGTKRRLDLTDDDDIALAQELFVPEGRRGFTLGTWDSMSKLPVGCRYIPTGDSTKIKINGVTVDDPSAAQTLVACDLKASHLNSTTAKDPKEACRMTYGDDVVVHVRAPHRAHATMQCDTSKPHCAGRPWDFGNL